MVHSLMGASEIKAPENEILTRLSNGSNSIKTRVNSLYQRFFSLANTPTHEKFLWSLDHTADSIGSANSAIQNLEKLSKFCDFWSQYKFPPEIPWNLKPRWNDASILLGSHLKRGESTLGGKLYQLENINNSDGAFSYETLGKPMDMMPLSQTFFSFLNQLSKYIICEPLLTVLGRRVVGEHAYYTGVLKEVYDVSKRVEQLLETYQEHLQGEALDSMQLFKTAFGDLKMEKYYYPANFTSLLCHTIVDIEQMFPAISLNQFTEIISCINATYLSQNVSHINGFLNDLIPLLNENISKDEVAQLWNILSGHPEPQSADFSENSLFGKIIHVRQILGESILNIIGKSDDDYRQQSMFGYIQLLKKKIGRYWETSADLQSRVDHLSQKIQQMRDIFEKNIHQSIEFPLSKIYTHLSQNWMLRMIEAIASFENKTDLSNVLNGDWVNTYIGFEDDYGDGDSLLSVLNQALKDVLVYPLTESIGEIKKIDYLDSGTDKNLSYSFTQIIDRVRSREIRQHSEIANFLLTDVLGETEKANKNTLLSRINFLGSVIRNTYLEWNNDFSQYLLEHIAYSWRGKTSLSDLLEQIQQAIPLEILTEADLRDLEIIFQSTSQVIGIDDLNAMYEWEAFIPYLNAILKDLFPAFVKSAFGSSNSRINFVEKAPIFSWVNGLLDSSKTQQTWRYALSDDVQTNLKEYVETLKAILDLFSKSNNQVKEEIIPELYRLIGGIMYSESFSLRGLMHTLFKKLYNNKTNDLYYVISKLNTQANQIYLALCCPCVKMDALIVACQLCIENIAAKINEAALPEEVNMTTFVRNNLVALNLISEKVDQLFNEVSIFTDCLCNVKESEGEYYCKVNEKVIGSLESFPALLSQISDHLNIAMMSVSPNFDYTQTKGHDCNYLAQSIRPLASSIDYLTNSIVQYFVKMKCFSSINITADQTQEYKAFLQKIAKNIMGCFHQISNIKYLLMYDDNFGKDFCKTCLEQTMITNSVTDLVGSCENLSNQLIQIANTL